MDKVNSLSVEELLKPRIIVENNYPRSPFKHHEIICEPSNQQVAWAKEFTLNFRFLNWWEERKEEDMPEYVKNRISGNVAPLSTFLKNYNFFLNEFLPATKEEYENQK